MRRHLAFVTAAVCVLGFSSCGSTTESEPVDGVMHADIVGSGDPWDAEKSLNATLANGKLIIAGVEASNDAITLTIYDPEVGAFAMRAGELVPRIDATYSSKSFSYSSSQTGGLADIAITELSATKVVGTFTFISTPIIFDSQLTPAYRAVNGTFNVKVR